MRMVTKEADSGASLWNLIQSLWQMSDQLLLLIAMSSKQSSNNSQSCNIFLAITGY